MKMFRNLVLAAALAISTLVAPITATAGAFTDVFEGLLVGHLFRSAPYTAPTTWYVGLLTSACSESAAGTEVTGGSYARVAVASGVGNWAAPSAGNGTTSNVNIIAFPTPTAGWLTATHFGLYDAASAGNLLICQSLTVNKTINSGDTVTFPAGTLTVQVDN